MATDEFTLTRTEQDLLPSADDVRHYAATPLRARSVISVCVNPGLTQFERMPTAASSSAMVRLSPSSPALDAL